MNLSDVAHITGQEIITGKSDKGFFAEINFAEIKHGGVLAVAVDWGRTRLEAKKALAKKLQGQTIVTDAMNTFRREFNLPQKITVR